ncbi:hypothetical protein BpHYR1_012103 [Brachionus plicatilis]|uniref:Uncharacterized protein n=1 Tax=Brachionus plicatilis TaxID=10195 RepID=A0A3M7R316_BRAPC|nr:hypothetical protein BpHYR1_012103 [Brachionus plicatilis]
MITWSCLVDRYEMDEDADEESFSSESRSSDWLLTALVTKPSRHIDEPWPLSFGKLKASVAASESSRNCLARASFSNLIVSVEAAALFCLKYSSFLTIRFWSMSHLRSSQTLANSVGCSSDKMREFSFSRSIWQKKVRLDFVARFAWVLIKGELTRLGSNVSGTLKS